MNHKERRNAAKLLAKIIVISLIVIFVATGIYYWKGLEKLQNPDFPGAYYYQSV